MKLTLILVLLPFFSLAAKLKSEGQVSFEGVENGKAVKATINPGFHFNAESPAFAQSGKAKKDAKTRSDKEIIFELPESATGSYDLRFYVCDDAKTVCEMHKQAWSRSGLKSTEGSSGKTQSLEKSGEDRLGKGGSAEGKTAKGKGASEQFMKENLQAAFDRAKQEGKLVFIDFAGSWCPPCIRLEHEVFPTKEFKKATEKYVLVRLDVDKPENEKWMEKYEVKAFPTLVVANHEGEELDRFLDFQTSSRLSFRLTSIAKSAPETLSVLKEKAEKGDKKAQEQLAFSYLKALNYVDALHWYDKADMKVYRRAEARVGFWDGEVSDAKKEADKAKARENLKLAYKESAVQYPETILAIDWLKGYADLLDEDGNKETAKLEYEKAKALAMKWIEDKKRVNPPELGDLTLPELWSKVADIEEKIGTPEALKAAREKSIEETLKLKPTVKTPTHIIYLVAYMKPVRELKDIEPWLEKLEAAYPTEFTYFQRHAKLLLDKGEPNKALEVGEKAYSLAFGTNKLNVGLLLAKIHKELENKDQAKALIKELKSQPHFSSKRNRYAAKAITDFEVTLR